MTLKMMAKNSSIGLRNYSYNLIILFRYHSCNTVAYILLVGFKLIVGILYTFIHIHIPLTGYTLPLWLLQDGVAVRVHCSWSSRSYHAMQSLQSTLKATPICSSHSASLFSQSEESYLDVYIFAQKQLVKSHSVHSHFVLLPLGPQSHVRILM